MGFEQQLSSFAHNFSLEKVDQKVVDRAKLIILDSIASIVEGNLMQEPNNLAQRFSKLQSSSVSTVLGTQFQSESHLAALVNALGMVSQELDEGNQLAKGHPACHFIPALLAVSEKDQKNGRQFLESFVVGYELGARVGASITLKENIHPHGNWGLIGASFALGKIEGFAYEEYVQALAVSGSLPYISLWQPVLEGHRMRDLFIGLTNLNAVLLPNIVLSGYSGRIESIEEIYTQHLGTHFDSQRLVDEIGVKYYLMHSYFKFYPFCRFCHAPIDAVYRFKEMEDVTSEMIQEINVYTYASASKLNFQNVRNQFAGKFSIPYTMATTMVQLEHNIINVNERVKELANKINVFEDPEITKLLPKERKTRVEILLTYGKTLTLEVTQGLNAEPSSNENELRQKVIQKADKMLRAVLGNEKSKTLIDTILELENVEDMREVARSTIP